MPHKWYDLALLALYIYFGFFKAYKLDRRSSLGRSFALYNTVLALLFFSSIFLLPLLPMPKGIEDGILTVGRAALVASIVWCIVELEKIRSSTRRELVIAALVGLGFVALVLFTVHLGL